jgi:hypothetical protein
MSTVSLIDSKNAGYPANSGLIGRKQYVARELLGSEFSVGASGDSFKVLTVAANQLITEVRVIVSDVDNSANSVDIGYTDGTNTSATYFSAAIDLTAKKVLAVISAKQLLCAYDTDIIIVPNDTLESDTRFTVIVEVVDLSNKQNEALTAPIDNA